MANQDPSTQSHLDIDDIRENLVSLKNGNWALVLETNSLNFELLADDEQDVRILSFSSLLNSVNYPIQIVIRTERADLNDYMEKLGQYRNQFASPALQKQMDIYIKFIRNLTTKTQVLNKRFLIVIATQYTTLSKSGGILPFGGKKDNPVEKIDLQRVKDYLYPKRDSLIKQFKKIGLQAIQLNNDQLIQLYYSIYDPDKVGVKKVELSAQNYTSGVVETLTRERVEDLLDDGQKNNANNS